jgi:hypothetical protein
VPPFFGQEIADGSDNVQILNFAVSNNPIV